MTLPPINATPLPGHPAPRREPGGGRTAAGDAFAELLASLGGTGDPASFLGQQPSLGSGAQGRGKDVAEMFNEHGLLHGTVPAIAAELAPGADAAAKAEMAQISAERRRPLDRPPAPALAPVVPAPTNDAPAPAPGAEKAALAAPTGPARQQTIAAPGSPRAARSARAAPEALLQVAKPAPPVARDEAAKVRDNPRQAGPARFGALLEAQLRQRGAVNAQVLLQAAEQGVSVTVRSGKLSGDERAKLRAEIQELLAQHGISASEIRLNGRVQSLLQWRR